MDAHDGDARAGSTAASPAALPPTATPAAWTRRTGSGRSASPSRRPRPTGAARAWRRVRSGNGPLVEATPPAMRVSIRISSSGTRERREDGIGGSRSAPSVRTTIRPIGLATTSGRWVSRAVPMVLVPHWICARWTHQGQFTFKRKAFPNTRPKTPGRFPSASCMPSQTR